MANLYYVPVYGSEEMIDEVHLSIFADTPMDAYNKAREEMKTESVMFALLKLRLRNDALFPSNRIRDVGTGDWEDVDPDMECGFDTLWEVTFSQEVRILVEASNATNAREVASRLRNLPRGQVVVKKSHIVSVGIVENM